MAANDYLFDLAGILAVLVLVAANGFFVASEFSLVAMRRSRVVELAETGEARAGALLRAVDHLDANLAATQLGITISSLALGWIGEPALAHLVEPLFIALPAGWAAASAHGIAVGIAFIIITALHIVLGELAPKSLALQRTEGTALSVVRPLGLFLLLLRPAVILLNGLGNIVLGIIGLKPGTSEEALHSPEELKLLIAASQEAGLIERAQQQVMERVFNIGDRHIADIMTPRINVDWIDADDAREEMLQTIRRCRHEQLLVGRGSIDEPIGMVLKKDLLDQVLDDGTLDPMAVIRQPLVVHEASTILHVLDQFKQAPARLAMIVDEYGTLEGIVTQTDLLEAIAGDLADAGGGHPAIVQQADGSFMIDGMMPAYEAFEHLGIRETPEDDDFHTIAGFAVLRLEHIPEAGEQFDYQGWRFEVAEMDRRRIAKLAARPAGTAAAPGRP